MVFHKLLHDNWNTTSWFFERLAFFTRFSAWIWFWVLLWVTSITLFLLFIIRIIEVIFILELVIFKRLSFMLEFWECIGVDQFLELILESWTLSKVKHVLLLSVLLVTYFDHKRAWIILWFTSKFFLLRVDLIFWLNLVEDLLGSSVCCLRESDCLRELFTDLFLFLIYLMTSFLFLSL